MILEWYFWYWRTRGIYYGIFSAKNPRFAVT